LSDLVEDEWIRMLGIHDDKTAVVLSYWLASHCENGLAHEGYRAQRRRRRQSLPAVEHHGFPIETIDVQAMDENVGAVLGNDPGPIHLKIAAGGNLQQAAPIRFR